MAGRIGFAAHAIILMYAGLAVAACPPGALAQEDPVPPDEPGRLESKAPDIENGSKLARTLCTTCHLIGEPTEHPVPADVPSFVSIANRPGQTLDHLSNWLTEPHPPMPNLNLTRTEIRDLAGYIFSLRKE
ncbi:MAG TPA: hypothetical protein VHC71_11795 [Hyphomicrobium sp.]|nr:hypothetical protein [Hyphomicrobium sp.]